MPQGFKNSPSIFQRAMSIIFQDLIGTSCLVYIDDILIFGETREIHDKNLKLVLGRMAKYDLKENTDKRKFCLVKIEFLGYEISYNKIKPLVKRAQGIVDYNVPKTKKQLQRFIGMMNYDRNFIKGITEIAKPLYELLNKDVKFVWNEVHEAAFIKIKQKWKEELELYIPDMNKRFELETDASNIGLGAILRQEGRPVTYLSRSLTGAEKNYSISEKEVLAAMWAMEKLSYILLGREFDLITDHKAIEEIKKKRDFGSQKIYRWFESLERFQYKVIYKPGEQLIVADALSRSPKKKIGEREEGDTLLKNKILNMHEKLNHRKNILKDLKDEGVIISEKNLRNILLKCIVCLKKESKKENSC